jgi:hypothetical protein
MQMSYKIEYSKLVSLASWNGNPIRFNVLMRGEVHKIVVIKANYVNVIFDDEKVISVGLNNRNPFQKFDKAAYVDKDNWLWVGQVYSED